MSGRKLKRDDAEQHSECPHVEAKYRFQTIFATMAEIGPIEFDWFSKNQ